MLRKGERGLTYYYKEARLSHPPDIKGVFLNWNLKLLIDRNPQPRQRSARLYYFQISLIIQYCKIINFKQQHRLYSHIVNVILRHNSLNKWIFWLEQTRLHREGSFVGGLQMLEIKYFWNYSIFMLMCRMWFVSVEINLMFFHYEEKVVVYLFCLRYIFRNRIHWNFLDFLL